VVCERFSQKSLEDRGQPADKSLNQRLAHRLRVDDRNLTGAAESARTQETKKSNRTQGARTGTVAIKETLARAMSAFGSERANRVPALAAQYRSGSYYADSAATAGSMVSGALLAEGL
jgi:anti-sigma28 factor (negative regulator of flagellin synthesis)